MFPTAANIFLFNKTPLSSCSVYALNKSNLKMNLLWLSPCPFYCFATLCWLYSICHVKQKLLIFPLKAFHKAISGIAFGAGKRGRGEANQVALTSSVSIGTNRDFYPDDQFWWFFFKSRTPRNTTIMHAQLSYAVHIHWVWCIKIVAMPIFLTSSVKIRKISMHFHTIWMRAPHALDFFSFFVSFSLLLSHFSPFPIICMDVKKKKQTTNPQRNNSVHLRAN